MNNDINYFFCVLSALEGFTHITKKNINNNEIDLPYLFNKQLRNCLEKHFKSTLYYMKKARLTSHICP